MGTFTAEVGEFYPNNVSIGIDDLTQLEVTARAVYAWDPTYSGQTQIYDVTTTWQLGDPGVDLLRFQYIDGIGSDGSFRVNMKMGDGGPELAVPGCTGFCEVTYSLDDFQQISMGTGSMNPSSLNGSMFAYTNDMYSQAVTDPNHGDIPLTPISNDCCFTFNFNGVYEITPVPIPAAAWLFGSALAGLGWFRRQKA